MRILDYVGGRWQQTLPGPYRGPAEPIPTYAPVMPPQETYLDLMRRLWRQRGIILGITAAFTLLAIVVAKMLPSYYIGESRVLIGVPGLHVLNIESLVADIDPDSDRIQNEGYIIASRAIAAQTIERLGLDRNAEFNPSLRPPSFTSKLMEDLSE